MKKTLLIILLLSSCAASPVKRDCEDEIKLLKSQLKLEQLIRRKAELLSNFLQIEQQIKNAQTEVKLNEPKREGK